MKKCNGFTVVELVLSMGLIVGGLASAYVVAHFLLKFW